MQVFEVQLFSETSSAASSLKSSEFFQSKQFDSEKNVVLLIQGTNKRNKIIFYLLRLPMTVVRQEVRKSNNSKKSNSGRNKKRLLSKRKR